MRNLLLPLFIFLTSNFIFGQDGVLVSTFGDQGISINSVLDGDSELADVVYYNSSYYAVGTADVDGRTELLAMKFDENGSLVSNFATGGFLSIPKGSGASELTRVMIADDGNLLAAGWMRDGNNEVSLMIKFDESGHLVNSFGDGGIVELRIASSSFGEDRANDIIQKDGRIYYSSISYTGLSDVIGVACLESDGSLCADFGNSGKINHTIDGAIGSHGAEVMIEHPEGGFIIGGEVKFDFFDENSLFLFKIDNLGQVDESFGDAGVSVFGFGGDLKTGLNDIIIDSESKIVVGGGAFDTENLDNNFFVARFDLDGDLDSSYGDDGVNVLALNGNESIDRLILNPDGRIIAGGGTGGFPSNFMIARYTTDGQLDNTFGNGGYTQSSFVQGFNSINGINFGANENIVAVGHVDANGRSTAIALYTNTFFVNTFDTELAKAVHVSPNPFSDQLSIDFDSEISQSVSIKIYDQLGRVYFNESVKVSEGANSIAIPQASELTTGTYYINLRTQKGMITQLLVKK